MERSDDATIHTDAITYAPLDCVGEVDEPNPKTSGRQWMLHVSPNLPPALQRSNWSLEDFELHKELYHGKSSLVYLATDKLSETHLVLKLYRKRKLSSLNRFQVEREIRLHIGLDNDNIIKLYAAFEDEYNLYMVQELADHGDLFDSLRRGGGQYKEKQAVQDVIIPLLNVLAYLHGRNIIHRDIKPENMLLSAGKVMKLADFGLSINWAEERPVTRAGTLDYMAPEVLICPDKRRPEENKDKPLLAYTAQVDIWAVGVLAYELLVGYPPFENESRTVTYENIIYKDPRFPSWMSADACKFIKAALSKNVNNRPGVHELLKHPWIQNNTPTTNSSRQQPRPSQARPSSNGELKRHGSSSLPWSSGKQLHTSSQGSSPKGTDSTAAKGSPTAAAAAGKLQRPPGLTVETSSTGLLYSTGSSSPKGQTLASGKAGRTSTLGVETSAGSFTYSVGGSLFKGPMLRTAKLQRPPALSVERSSSSLLYGSTGVGSSSCSFAATRSQPSEQQQLQSSGSSTMATADRQQQQRQHAFTGTAASQLECTFRTRSGLNLMSDLDQDAPYMGTDLSPKTVVSPTGTRTEKSGSSLSSDEIYVLPCTIQELGKEGQGSSGESDVFGTLAEVLVQEKSMIWGPDSPYEQQQQELWQAGRQQGPHQQQQQQPSPTLVPTPPAQLARLPSSSHRLGLHRLSCINDPQQPPLLHATSTESSGSARSTSKCEQIIADVPTASIPASLPGAMVASGAAGKQSGAAAYQRLAVTLDGTYTGKQQQQPRQQQLEQPSRAALAAGTYEALLGEANSLRSLQTKQGWQKAASGGRAEGTAALLSSSLRLSSLSMLEPSTTERTTEAATFHTKEAAKSTVSKLLSKMWHGSKGHHPSQDSSLVPTPRQDSSNSFLGRDAFSGHVTLRQDSPIPAGRVDSGSLPLGMNSVEFKHHISRSQGSSGLSTTQASRPSNMGHGHGDVVLAGALNAVGRVSSDNMLGRTMRLDLGVAVSCRSLLVPKQPAGKKIERGPLVSKIEQYIKAHHCSGNAV